MKKNLSSNVVLALVVILGVSYIFRSITENEEYNNSYNFVIAKTEFTPTGYYVLYNKDEERFSFSRYLISSHEIIKAGDSLSKAAKSDYLYIYKRNSKGVYYKALGYFKSSGRYLKHDYK